MSDNVGRDADDLGKGDVSLLGTVAVLTCPASGIKLTVISSEPQVQTYYSTLLGDTVGKRGVVYKRHGAVCLESQRFSNAVNRPSFPSQVVRPSNPYHQKTVWRFEAL